MDDIVVQEFVNAIKDSPTDPNTTYSAKVSRVDKDGTVWVNLFGSEKETPTASTSSEVKRGDSVNVNWRNNKLYIDGNYSNPSSGVESTKRVEGVANDAKQIAGIAYEAANNAVADAERARVAAESAEADALSAAQSSASAGESASRAQAASEAAQLAALSSITTDTIHYLATDLDSGITTADPPAGHGSWSTTIQTMTATNKYLWTYHTYTTAGGATRDTTPALTGTYGEKGADGTSVTILGSYNTLAELEQAHPTGARGDAYMVSGDLYVWNGSAWENVGQIQGPQGPQGIQGNSVTVFSIAYAVTSTESEPQSYPYSTVPTVPEGSWLWTKTTYSDGNVAISKSKQGVSGTNGTNGRDGRDGTNGTNGTNGISVSAVQPQYYLSTSSAEAIGGSWSTSLTYVTGKFIWTRDYITYSDNTHGTSTAIYNQALTESCYNAAEALGLISEQQQYFYHDSLGAHVLSSPNTTGVRYRTDIEGAGLEINELSGSTEKSVATFGAEQARIGRSDGARVVIAPNELAMITEEGIQAIQVDNDGNTQDVYKRNPLSLDFSTNSVTHAVSSEPQTNQEVWYTVLSQIGIVGYYTVVEIEKGVPDSGTIDWNGTDLYSYVYDGSEITFTRIASGTFTVQDEAYWVTQTGPKTTIGGVLALGKNADTSRGEVLFAVGDGSGSNGFEVQDSGRALVKEDLYVYGSIYPNYGTSPTGDSMGDFVISQGTSGIWTYRIWNSGLKECWGTYTASIAVTTASAGYGGYRSGSLNIPTFPVTFDNPPSVTATVGSAGGVWINNVHTITTTGGSFYLSCGASSAATNRIIYFHVIGT